MVGLRLFLPETWVGDPTRLERADVPAEYRSARTKSEIALAELDRLIAAGVRFGTVLADAGYGMGAEFRQALSARGLACAVGIPRHEKVYPRDVELVFPVPGRGRPRKRHVPKPLSVTSEDRRRAICPEADLWRGQISHASRQLSKNGHANQRSFREPLARVSFGAAP
jgi:SRSO17 transposase